MMMTLLVLLSISSAHASWELTVFFNGGKQTTFQYNDMEEVLLHFQSRESCPVGMVKIEIEQVIVEGMDD